MRPLSDRTAGFTDSIIRRMTRISNRHGAINLSQGFPDFDPPRELTDRLAEIAPTAHTSMPSPGGRRTSARHWHGSRAGGRVCPSTPTRTLW